MNDIIASLLIVFVTFAGYLLLTTRLSRMEKVVWVGSLVAHVLGTITQIWIHVDYYGYGDMLSYLREGAILADLIRIDEFRYLPEVLALVAQREVALPIFIHGLGDSTGTMSGLSALGLWMTNDSMYGTCMLFAMASYVGKLMIFMAIRPKVPEALHVRLGIAIGLVPSVVLWSCGVIKESVAITGIGLMTYGFFVAVDRRKIWAVAMALAGAVIALVSKGFFVLAFASAAATWLYWRYTLRNVGEVRIFRNPVRAFLAIACAVGAVLLIGALIPRFSMITLVEEAQHLQTVGQGIRGGSNYTIVGDEGGIIAQILGAPVAVVTSLFRPFIFEAHNVISFANSLETTALLAVVVVLLSTRGLRGCWGIVRKNPVMIFCLVFVLMLSVGVGLATTNLGTLSRYRAPMMPFYVTLVVLLVPFGRGVRRLTHESRTKSTPNRSSAS